MSFDEQTYAPSHGLVRERRKGAALELSNWWTADVRLGARAAYDTWSASGGHLSLGLDLDRRTWADRVSLRGTAALFVPLEGGAAFVSSSLRLAARTSAAPARLAFRGELSYDSTAVRAPRGLWPGAGTGQGRGRLLRAHPLLDGGVVSGPAFGPDLVRAGIEAEAGLLTLAAFRVSLAVFADAAALPHGARGSRSFLDLGAGLRLALPGTSTSLRADLALPASGGPPVFSFGVVRAWPN